MASNLLTSYGTFVAVPTRTMLKAAQIGLSVSMRIGNDEPHWRRATQSCPWVCINYYIIRRSCALSHCSMIIRIGRSKEGEVLYPEHYMTVQLEFCYSKAHQLRTDAFKAMRDRPSSQSCRTSCFASRGLASDRRDRRASLLVEARTPSSCAEEQDEILWSTNLLRELTRIIFVSSNSACTRMMLSACLGSWYFCR